ncbi:DUF190 domain-containing protein [Parachitinimonas caeni]|uniref:DUF190 domain-containing protein n=1 Tax=Parachitinimonas caeni TaxID=3031301 RepID=A0ABT7DSN2_9NEIS|nr:DUF190 domain-containing protein [Parachitinimonas caeni]MDK2123075.1 DUF190 domain-containing protein [Parachitinimonas caeni]
MKGFQLTFITQQNKQHAGKPVAEWLLQEARQLGIQGATVLAASEGYGRHGQLHAARFIELADQPVEIVLAVTLDEAERLFASLAAQRLDLFYIKTPIEFGWCSERSANRT